VAVAEGSARVALSTDTGGSGRIPAALCGVVGFKPASGTYPLRGVLPLAPTLDHVGVMAASTADVIRVHEVLAGPVPAGVRAPVVGVVEASAGAAEPAVAEVIEAALRRLAAAGCRLRPVSVADGAQVMAASTAILFAEAAATHAATRDRWEAEVGPDVQGRLLAGTRVTREDHEAALAQREVLTRRVRAALRGVDVLATPTVRIRPPALAGADDPGLPALLVAETRLANLTGLPAITLPVGGAVGLQLMGAGDERLLAHAAWIERALA
jgi:Asp-tRNA(Asn)/Glu-tRNA(Gln) amidotransferase A subunit family amidase